MIDAIRSFETSILTRGTSRHVTKDGILHIPRRKNLKSYVVPTGWAMYRRRNVSPVKCEQGFYIPEDDFLLQFLLFFWPIFQLLLLSLLHAYRKGNTSFCLPVSVLCLLLRATI
jgi:hypothetical protein